MRPPLPQTMKCMEVWGGNRATEDAIVMSGLGAWIYCRPHANAVQGGDIYYVSSCATGRITRLVIADVSGHGSAVSEVATTLRRLMRQYINFLDQTRFVEAMNRQFTKITADACFATAIVTTFFAANGHLSLSNAGHPPALLYRAVERTWTLIQGEGAGGCDIADIPLGIDHACRYSHFEVELSVGDLVLCYTDSLIEAKRLGGSMLGVAGLMEIVRSIEVVDPGSFVPTLLKALTQIAPGNLDADDVTVLLFSPNGVGRKMSLRQKLLAPFRLARAFGAAIRNHEPIPRPELTLANLGGAVFEPFGLRWSGRRGG